MNITVNGVSITLTPNQLKQIDEEVKKQTAPAEPSAREWLLDFLSQEFTVKFGKDRIAYYINGQWVFDLDFKKKTLWCYYYKVWEVFYTKYKMNYNQVQQLIKDVVLEPLNCNGFTPMKNI